MGSAVIRPDRSMERLTGVSFPSVRYAGLIVVAKVRAGRGRAVVGN